MSFFTKIKAKILKFLWKYKRCQIIQTIQNKVAGDVIVPYTTESKKEKQTQRSVEWEGGPVCQLLVYKYFLFFTSLPKFVIFCYF